MTDRSDAKQIPPWLRNVPLPPRPPELVADVRAVPLPTPVAPNVDSSPAEDIPDWLKGLAETDLSSTAPSALSAAPSEQIQDLPAWLTNLSGTSDQGTSSTEPTSSDQDIPDWLRTSDATPALSNATLPNQAKTPESPSLPTGRSSSGFTGWLTTGDELSASTPITPTPATPTPTPLQETHAAEELPAWLRNSIDSSSSDSGSEPLPNWLQNLEPQSADRSSETKPAPPSWIHETVPGVPDVLIPSAPEAPKTDTPSWLQSSTINPASAPPPPPEPSTDADLEGLPNWLQSISDDDIRRVTEGDDTDDADLGIAPFSIGGEDEAATPSEPPGWLTSLPEADQPRPSGEASEWLGASASQLIQARPPSTPDVPEWLREAAQDDSEDEAPAWLRGPESPTTSASELTVSPGSPAADVPAWLRDDAGTNPEADQPPLSEDIPAWLREHGPTIASQTESVISVPPLTYAGDVASEPSLPMPEQPAWLSTPVPTPTKSDTPADTLPDWLTDDAPMLAPDSAVSPVAPVAGDDLPTWLRDTAETTVDPIASTLPPWLRDEAGQPMPSAMAPGDINLPTWLRGADTPLATTSVVAPATPADLPSNLDWFDDSTKQASPTSSSELLGGADLPAWLRSETERPREINPVDARSLDWLAHLGSYDDDTPVTTSATALPRLMLPADPTRTPAQIEALALLQRMTSTPVPQTAPTVEASVARPLSRISIEQIFSLLLLMVLIVGLLIPGLAPTIVGTASAPSPAAAALLEQMKPLGENDIVLIGYEWDAQRISELRPLERAVIDQLIAQRVKLVLVSTDPQGTMLQFDLRDRLNAAKYQGGGLDYVLLGYRPGGEIGLRQLAQNLRGALRRDFQGFDATIGALATNLSTSAPRLSTLNDFAMAIVFADEPTDVQGWMEQIRPFMKKPLVFLVPAGVQPISQPYFRQPGIYALAGTQGALAYEELRGGSDTAQTSLSASQLRFATLLFSAFLALGLISVLVRTALHRPRSKS